MPTPKAGYFIDGVRVPGVTTILGRFKESGGLIHWGWNIPFVGLCEARALLADALSARELIAQSNAFLEKPLTEWDYRAKRDRAADAGTIAHEMMDSFIHDRVFDSAPYKPELIELARPAFSAFLEWAEGCKFTMQETETQLVSLQHRFGGTRDAILVNGKRALGDWKTSNRIYPEYLLQLAAYAILDEENGGQIDGGFHLLKFSKQERPDDPIRFSHFYWNQLDLAKEAFLKARSLYDDFKRLEGMVK